MDWLLVIRGVESANYRVFLTNMGLDNIYQIIGCYDDNVQEDESNVKLLNLLNTNVKINDKIYLLSEVEENIILGNIPILRKKINGIVDYSSFHIIMKQMCKKDSNINKNYIRLFS